MRPISVVYPHNGLHLSPVRSTMRKLTIFVAGLTLFVAAAPVHAHHSFAAEFDATKPVKMTGTVTKIEWTNPHVWFYVDIKDKTGKHTNWGLELGSPNGLMRGGWTKNSMKLGEVITVGCRDATAGRYHVTGREV